MQHSHWRPTARKNTIQILAWIQSLLVCPICLEAKADGIAQHVTRRSFCGRQTALCQMQPVGGSKKTYSWVRAISTLKKAYKNSCGMWDPLEGGVGCTFSLADRGMRKRNESYYKTQGKSCQNNARINMARYCFFPSALNKEIMRSIVAWYCDIGFPFLMVNGNRADCEGGDHTVNPEQHCFRPSRIPQSTRNGFFGNSFPLASQRCLLWKKMKQPEMQWESCFVPAARSSGLATLKGSRPSASIWRRVLAGVWSLASSSALADGRRT